MSLVGDQYAVVIATRFVRVSVRVISMIMASCFSFTSLENFDYSVPFTHPSLLTVRGEISNLFYSNKKDQRVAPKYSYHIGVVGCPLSLD